MRHTMKTAISLAISCIGAGWMIGNIYFWVWATSYSQWGAVPAIFTALVIPAMLGAYVLDLTEAKDRKP